MPTIPWLCFCTKENKESHEFSDSYLPKVGEEFREIDEDDDPCDGECCHQSGLKVADDGNVITPMKNMVEPIVLRGISLGERNLFFMLSAKE